MIIIVLSLGKLLNLFLYMLLTVRGHTILGLGDFAAKVHRVLILHESLWL